MDVAVSFINTLTDQATETVTIRTFSNQKPWVDRSIRDAVNHRTAAYNAGLLSGNMSDYKTLCYDFVHDSADQRARKQQTEQRCLCYHLFRGRRSEGTKESERQESSRT